MRTFAITFDYLCPFARNGSEHVVAGLRDGADWDVTFTPFSLAQSHVQHGDPDVWDLEDPAVASGVLALQVGLAVRDHLPHAFLDVHLGLFAARPDDGRDIKDPAVLRDVVAAAGLDPDEVFEIVDGGGPLEALRKEHRYAADEHHVWGVPTFIAGDRAVFVRLIERPDGDPALARDTIDRVVDQVAGWSIVHEFKQTDLPI